MNTTTMVTVGIDPGATGAIAFLDNDDGHLIGVCDMPHADKHVLAPLLAELLDGGTRFTVRTAWVERAQSMPHQGVVSTFTYGVTYGTVLGVLGALRIPTETVHPRVWKQAAGLSKDKGASRRHAIELWPAQRSRFSLVKHDGRAEAALIARYGWRQTHQRTP